MQPPPGQLQCPNCLIYVGINTSLEKEKKNYCRWCLMKTAQANKNDKKTHWLVWLHQFNCWQTFPLFWSVHVLHLRWAGFRRVTGHSVLRPALSCCFKLQEVTPLALLLCCLFFLAFKHWWVFTRRKERVQVSWCFYFDFVCFPVFFLLTSELGSVQLPLRTSRLWQRALPSDKSRSQTFINASHLSR